MNTKILFTAMAGAALLMSCSVTRKSASPAQIAGEWNITAVEGSAVTAQPFPYIGFDTKEGRIYGNSGCNRITGSFDFKGKSGKIELGQMASTLMACPNMELEQSVLRALASVTRIEASDAEHLVLCDKKKTPLLQLEKRFRVVPLADIRGEWRIVSVFGEKFPAIQQVPFVNFDTENTRIAAYAGCNRISGALKSGETPNGISISGVVTTRMACPDMTAERNVLSALEQVRSFGILPSGNLVLFSAGGNPVMELMRHK